MKCLRVAEALDAGFLSQTVSEKDIGIFRGEFKKIWEISQSKNAENESEGFYENLIRDFLKNVFYSGNYEINKYNKYGSRCDIAITEKNGKDEVLKVIFEAKRPDKNKTEMLSLDFGEVKDLNKKAFAEVLYYFLNEYVTNGNYNISSLVITNFDDWYIFNAQDFAQYFGKNPDFLKEYKAFYNKQLTDKNTSAFYEKIAPKYIPGFIEKDVKVVKFSLKEIADHIENDEIVARYYKILSPIFLLKKSYTNDANSLNREFYEELLYIMGLEEVESDGVVLIKRCAKERRENFSLIENAMFQLQNKNIQDDEECFEVALKLVIVWVNRILFLKLLDGQLRVYKTDSKMLQNGFMNVSYINTFQALNQLFFNVLAVREDERNERYCMLFEIPYLNSSLFERSSEEVRYGLEISGLENGTILYFKNTVVHHTEKPIKIFEYIFDFLNSYNFSSQGKKQVVADEKTVINAAVLGLIFEKINGYKDGSVFTPSFITQYMAHDVVERAVLRKFSEQWSEGSGQGTVDSGQKSGDSDSDSGGDDTVGRFDTPFSTATFRQAQCTAQRPRFSSINEIAWAIDRGLISEDEARKIVNSVRVLDPAVGSGHFLVSCLNEFVVVKKELGLLKSPLGKYVTGYNIKIQNDDLQVTDKNGKPYFYNIHDEDGRIVQEALFNEKREIIENNLFGVDINPNSVNICRLRLWIELLKNMYCTAESNYTKFETLPNIDINIKCGNSLLSKFDVNAIKGESEDLFLNALCDTVKEYKKNVSAYKNEDDKVLRRELEKNIASEKAEITTELNKVFSTDSGSSGQGSGDSGQGSLSSANGTYRNDYNTDGRFDTSPYGDTQRPLKADDFEWLIEFPEVLSDTGDFLGFDAVIGNPPYIESRNSSFSIDMKKAIQVQLKNIYQNGDYKFFPQGADILIYFYELALRLIKPTGINAFVTENSWLSTDYGKMFQNFLQKYASDITIVDYDNKYFFSANVNTIITFMKRKNENATTPLNFYHYHGELADNSKLSKKVFSSDNKLLANYKWGFLNKVDNDLLELLEIMTQKNNFDVSNKFEIGQGLNLKKENILTSQTENSVPYFISSEGSLYCWQKANFYIDKNLLSKTRRMPVLILPRGIGTHFCCLNSAKGYSASYVEFYSQSCTENELLNLWLFCNSSLLWLLRECSGRTNLGGGMLKAEATDLKTLPLYFDFNKSNEIKTIFENAKNSCVPTNIDEAVNSEIHKTIDKIVFEYFNVTEKQELFVNMLKNAVHARIDKSKKKAEIE